MSSGKWCARRYDEVTKTYVVETMKGVADDKEDPDGISVFSFYMAQDWARAWYGEHKKTDSESEFTIEAAVSAYADKLQQTGTRDPYNARRVRLHLGDLGSRKIIELEAKHYEDWRDGLLGSMTAAAANRTATCLRAALNLAASRDKALRRQGGEWTRGLNAIAGATKTRNKTSILPEPVIRSLIDAAASEGPEFQLLMEVLAVTGTRISQAARLEVENLQDRRDNPRLLMPTSAKGNGPKTITHRPVPISQALATKLRAIVKGRPMTDILLLKASDQPWKKSDQSERFVRVVKRAGLDPKLSVYSLRHSSIVRQLLRGVPARLVAVAHDTSIVQLERTYSAFIDDHADEMLREALLDISGPAHRG